MCDDCVTDLSTLPTNSDVLIAPSLYDVIPDIVPANSSILSISYMYSDITYDIVKSREVI